MMHTSQNVIIRKASESRKVRFTETKEVFSRNHTLETKRTRISNIQIQEVVQNYRTTDDECHETYDKESETDDVFQDSLDSADGEEHESDVTDVKENRRKHLRKHKKVISSETRSSDDDEESVDAKSHHHHQHQVETKARKRTSSSLLTDDEYDGVEELRIIVQKEIERFQENIQSEIEIDPEYIHKQNVEEVEHTPTPDNVPASSENVHVSSENVHVSSEKIQVPENATTSSEQRHNVVVSRTRVKSENKPLKKKKKKNNHASEIQEASFRLSGVVQTSQKDKMFENMQNIRTSNTSTDPSSCNLLLKDSMSGSPDICPTSLQEEFDQKNDLKQLNDPLSTYSKVYDQTHENLQSVKHPLNLNAEKSQQGFVKQLTTDHQKVRRDFGKKKSVNTSLKSTDENQSAVGNETPFVSGKKTNPFISDENESAVGDETQSIVDNEIPSTVNNETPFVSGKRTNPFISDKTPSAIGNETSNDVDAKLDIAGSIASKNHPPPPSKKNHPPPPSEETILKNRCSGKDILPNMSRVKSRTFSDSAMQHKPFDPSKTYQRFKGRSASLTSEKTDEEEKIKEIIEERRKKRKAEMKDDGTNIKPITKTVSSYQMDVIFSNHPTSQAATIERQKPSDLAPEQTVFMSEDDVGNTDASTESTNSQTNDSNITPLQKLQYDFSAILDRHDHLVNKTKPTVTESLKMESSLLSPGRIKYTGIMKYINPTLKTNSQPQATDSENKPAHKESKKELANRENKKQPVHKENIQELAHSQSLFERSASDDNDDVFKDPGKENITSEDEPTGAEKPAADWSKEVDEKSDRYMQPTSSITEEKEFSTGAEIMRNSSSNDIANRIECLLAEIDVCIVEHGGSKNNSSTSAKHAINTNIDGGELERSLKQMLVTIDDVIKENETKEDVDDPADSYESFTPYSIVRSRKEIQKKTSDNIGDVVDVDSFCIIELDEEEVESSEVKTAVKMNRSLHLSNAERVLVKYGGKAEGAEDNSYESLKGIMMGENFINTIISEDTEPDDGSSSDDETVVKEAQVVAKNSIIISKDTKPDDGRSAGDETVVKEVETVAKSDTKNFNNDESNLQGIQPVDDHTEHHVDANSYRDMGTNLNSNKNVSLAASTQSSYIHTSSKEITSLSDNGTYKNHFEISSITKTNNGVLSVSTKEQCKTEISRKKVERENGKNISSSSPGDSSNITKQSQNISKTEDKLENDLFHCFDDFQVVEQKNSIVNNQLVGSDTEDLTSQQKPDLKAEYSSSSKEGKWVGDENSDYITEDHSEINQLEEEEEASGESNDFKRTKEQKKEDLIIGHSEEQIINNINKPQELLNKRLTNTTSFRHLNDSTTLKINSIKNEQGKDVELIDYLTKHSDAIFVLSEKTSQQTSEQTNTAFVLTPVTADDDVSMEVDSITVHGTVRSNGDNDLVGNDKHSIEQTSVKNMLPENGIIAVVHDGDNKQVPTNNEQEVGSSRIRSKSESSEINIVFPNGYSPKRRTISFVFPGEKQTQRYATNLEVPCNEGAMTEKHISMLSVDGSQLSSPRLAHKGSFLTVAETIEPKSNNSIELSTSPKQWQYSVKSGEKGTCQMSIQVLLDPNVQERFETETFEYQYLLKETPRDGCVGEWVLVNCTKSEIEMFIELLRELLRREKERTTDIPAEENVKFCRIL